MIHTLRQEDFKNDFFTLIGEGQNRLIFNVIDERFGGIKVQGINIEFIGADKNIMCPSVIGIGNELMMLSAENTELLGKQLTFELIESVQVHFYG